MLSYTLRVGTWIMLVSCVAFMLEKHYVAAEVADQWTYFGIYGVMNWSASYANCNATAHPRQSPVNIVPEDALVNSKLSSVGLTFSPVASDEITMVNNGHTVSFAYNKTIFRLAGGNFMNTFRVAGIHFHWGSNDSEGSEHTINSVRSVMEMHIVTYDEGRYSNLLEASTGDDSIAVLGVLFELSPGNNTDLDPIITNLQRVKVAGIPITLPFFNLVKLLPSDTSWYYRYMGSLTTPPCSSNVIWTVFDTKQYISSKQLAEFRKVQEIIEPDGTIDYISDNWRPTQPLFNRVVQRSFTSLNQLSESCSNMKINSKMLIVMTVAFIYML